MNGTLFFSATDGTHGYEMWRSDGTAAGTRWSPTSTPAAPARSHTYLTNVNGTLFFAANDGVHGYQLWESNGTAARHPDGCRHPPGSAAPTPAYLTNMGGTLFFDANDGAHGVELWRSNGTAAGTALVADINPGAIDSYPGSLTNLNGTLLFSANDGTHGRQLWRTNGTAAGTQMVLDINPGSDLRSPNTLPMSTDCCSLRRPTEFTAPSSGRATPPPLAPAWSRTSIPARQRERCWLTNVERNVVLPGQRRGHGAELWRSQGTAIGTQLVADINPGHAGLYPRI